MCRLYSFLRTARAGETPFKRATAAGFYRLLARATEVDIPVDAGDFRLMSRRALDALLKLRLPPGVKVVRLDVDPQHNPFGLALDCYDGAPQRIEAPSPAVPPSGTPGGDPSQGGNP